MMITVTETRDCCQERDLKPYRGERQSPLPTTSGDFKFCRHCGQLHVEETYTDAAGGRDTRWRKWP